MQSVPELVEKHANAYARGLVRRIVQPGSLQSVLEQEIHAILAEIFQQRIEAEFAVATQRDRYDRVDGAPWRNGHKPVTVPGFGGPLNQAYLRSPRIPARSISVESAQILGTRLRTQVDLPGFAFRDICIRGKPGRCHIIVG